MVCVPRLWQQQRCRAGVCDFSLLQSCLEKREVCILLGKHEFGSCWFIFALFQRLVFFLWWFIRAVPPALGSLGPFPGLLEGGCAQPGPGMLLGISGVCLSLEFPASPLFPAVPCVFSPQAPPFPVSPG